MRKSSEKGQVLLIVVLVTVVALTIGLSVVSRSITNLEVSRQSEESQRAFQAAETGVEQALHSIRQTATSQAILSDELSNGAKFTAELSIVDGQEFLLNNGELIEQNVGFDIWLSEYPNYTNGVSDTIELFWSTEEQIFCNSSQVEEIEPAVEILLLSGDINNPDFEKYLYDGCGRISGADTPLGGSNIDGVVLQDSASISVTNGLLMKVIPIYNSTVVGVSMRNVSLPSQGSLIESVGQSGESVRKVVVFESFPQIPNEFFQYSILSQ